MTHARTPRVFVTQLDPNAHYDMSSLSDFGEVVPLFGRSIYPDEANERSCVMVRIARSKLADFDPSVDYLALSGDPVSVAMASSVLAGYVREKNSDKFVALKWDRLNNGYYEVPIGV